MYTAKTIYDDVVMLTRLNGHAKWVWAGTNSPGHADRSFWQDMATYCWTAYNKAHQSTGDALIGRMGDLVSIKQKVCNIDTKLGQTLRDEGTKGNALELDKWAPVLNDSWVLGHFHRGADFVLHSPRTCFNVWENSAGRIGLVVTAREMFGLLAFGYERKTIRGGEVRYVCTNRTLAQSASLTAYDRLIKAKEAQGRAAVMELIGIRDDLAEDIKNFDRNTLRSAQARVGPSVNQKSAYNGKRWPNPMDKMPF